MCSRSRAVFLAFCAPVLTTVTPERHTMHRHRAAGPGVTMPWNNKYKLISNEALLHVSPEGAFW